MLKWTVEVKRPDDRKLFCLRGEIGDQLSGATLFMTRNKTGGNEYLEGKKVIKGVCRHEESRSKVSPRHNFFF